MLRAILVSVDYADLLAVTLPYNRHHFQDVMVVTSPKDEATMQVAVANCCRTYITDAFYRNGATFNKWLALEEALDHYGREGWLCLMDADVLWPKKLPYEWHAPMGFLTTPLRRVREKTSDLLTDGIPPERNWKHYPVHRNIAEWAGYTQIFHCSDQALGSPPWHETDWKHAGGADSIFQRKWSKERKARPQWEVLHLGPCGANWYGRASTYLDGSIPDGAKDKCEAIERMWIERKSRRRAGMSEGESFIPEKISNQID